MGTLTPGQLLRRRAYALLGLVVAILICLGITQQARGLTSEAVLGSALGIFIWAIAWVFGHQLFFNPRPKTRTLRLSNHLK